MATQKVVVAGSDVTASQLKDFFRQIEDGSLRRWHIQALLDHQNPWDFSNVQLDWRAVYEKLGLLAQLDEFTAGQPLTVNQGEWSVPVVKGVIPNLVVKAFRTLGVTVVLYTDDLDADVTTNDRSPQNGSYTVRFQQTVEADPELANQSANMLAKAGVKGITLLERLLLGLAYFLATGEHLDMENITLCSGSRRSDGRVPDVDWDADDREVYVSAYGPACASPDLRSRSVIS